MMLISNARYGYSLVLGLSMEISYFAYLFICQCVCLGYHQTNGCIMDKLANKIHICLL